MLVIANQRRNAGVAIRIPCLPLGEGARRSGRMREKAPLADQGELPQCAHWG